MAPRCRWNREPPGGAANVVLTTEGLLVELHKVGEDVFGDGLLIWQTLEENDDFGLADGVHPFSRHVPALPVYVCGVRGKNVSGQSYIRDPLRKCSNMFYMNNNPLKKKSKKKITTYSQAEQHNHNTFYKQHNSDLKAVRRGQPQVLPPPGHFRE